MTPTFRYEKELWRKGYKVVVGTDEVGRGAWAGPIVAGAVVFAPATQNQISKIKNQKGIRIDDSKKLTAKQREKAEKWIKKNVLSWGIGEASVSQINKLGMARTSKTAFRRAISTCKKRLRSTDYRLQQDDNTVDSRLLTVDFLLIDAFYLPYTTGLPVGQNKRLTRSLLVKRKGKQLAIVNGDEKCFSVAAASIIAKVYRDKLMRRLSQKYPKYKWAKNKGYGTREHQEAIRKHGITKLHRKAFIGNVIPVPVLSQAPEDA